MSNGKSLEKLYLELFNEKISGAHDALNDVQATLKCYFKLLENNLLETELFV